MFTNAYEHSFRSSETVIGPIRFCIFINTHHYQIVVRNTFIEKNNIKILLLVRRILLSEHKIKY